MSEPSITRRRALGVTGAAALLPLLSPRIADAAPGSDGGLLAAAVTLEHNAVFAYTTAASARGLGPRTRALARLFAVQDRAHVDALATALRGMNESVPSPPTRAAFVPGLERAVGSDAAFVPYAIRLERAAIAGYRDAQRQLVDVRLMQSMASIMANQAQHLVLWREEAGDEPVPSAFEAGRAAPRTP